MYPHKRRAETQGGTRIKGEQMSTRTFLKKLLDFGFTEREAKLYLALLGQPEMTAADLHRASGVLRSKTYEILQQMVARGYCMERLDGRKRYYRAANPELLMQSIQSHWNEEIEDKIELREKTKESFDKRRSQLENEAEVSATKGEREIEIIEEKLQSSKFLFHELSEIYKNQHGNGQTLDSLEIIQNREHIRQRHQQLTNEVKKEVLTFQRSPWAAVTEEQREKQIDSSHENDDRGIKVRAIFLKEEASWDLFVEDLVKDTEVSQNESAKVTDHLPCKMFVFDRKKVLLAIPAAPGQTTTDFTMIIIQDPGLTQAFIDLFEFYWQESLTYPEWLEKEKTELSTDLKGD
jgi:HTH-type transcriptional regulator, sugar sensing transcriptional regulator